MVSFAAVAAVCKTARVIATLEAFVVADANSVPPSINLVL